MSGSSIGRETSDEQANTERDSVAIAVFKGLGLSVKERRYLVVDTEVGI